MLLHLCMDSAVSLRLECLPKNLLHVIVTTTLHNKLMIEVTDGRKERVQFDKITARVSRLCYGLNPEHIDAAAITQKVISGVYQGVTTVELDNLVRHLRH